MCYKKLFTDFADSNGIFQEFIPRIIEINSRRKFQSQLLTSFALDLMVSKIVSKRLLVQQVFLYKWRYLDYSNKFQAMSSADNPVYIASRFNG